MALRYYDNGRHVYTRVFCRIHAPELERGDKRSMSSDIFSLCFLLSTIQSETGLPRNDTVEQGNS